MAQEENHEDTHKGKKKRNKTPKKSAVKEEDGGADEKAEKMANGEQAFPPTFSVSEIKNKQRRHLMFMKFKQEKRKVNTPTHTHTCCLLNNISCLFPPNSLVLNFV